MPSGQTTTEFYPQTQCVSFNSLICIYAGLGWGGHHIVCVFVSSCLSSCLHRSTCPFGAGMDETVDDETGIKGLRKIIETDQCVEANFSTACSPTRVGFGKERTTFCFVFYRLLSIVPQTACRKLRLKDANASLSVLTNSILVGNVYMPVREQQLEENSLLTANL